jgi:tRNA A37 N6-isopentenylltransferase MiaA
MQQLIVIEGATASGKTALGVALAKHLNMGYSHQSSTSTP